MRSMLAILTVLFFSLPTIASAQDAEAFAVMVQKDKKDAPLYAIYKGEPYRVFQNVTAEHDDAEKRQVPYIMVEKDRFISVKGEKGSLAVGTFKKNDPSKKNDFEVYYVDPEDSNSVASLAEYIGNKPLPKQVWLFRRWGGGGCCGGGGYYGGWWGSRCNYGYGYGYGGYGACGYGGCGSNVVVVNNYPMYPVYPTYQQFVQSTTYTTISSPYYGGGYYGGYGGYGGAGYGGGYATPYVSYAPYWNMS